MEQTSPPAQSDNQVAAEPAPVTNEAIRVLNLYQTADKIYTRSLEGFFHSFRRWTWIPMLAGYFLIPWISINGRQAVWFDLAERKFYIFWLTLWLMPLVWSIFFISTFLSLNWGWLLCTVVGNVLSGANLYGYIKCSRAAKEKVGDPKPQTPKP